MTYFEVTYTDRVSANSYTEAKELILKVILETPEIFKAYSKIKVVKND